ncbi:MAG: hypothetical protein HZA16_10435 [Nitrospirae bacterium]|nr:hypothetical protein [Nitrospirota bacterium]
MIKQIQLCKKFFLIVSTLSIATCFTLDGDAISAGGEISAETLALQKEEPKPGKCLSDAEADLARLINEYRKQHNLSEVPVMETLYLTAKWHVIDLSLHEPHKGKKDPLGKKCDLRSWSDKGAGRGNWKPVCYTSDHAHALDILEKPAEIAGYKGNAYENVYWTSAPLTPEMVLRAWQNRPGERGLIIEEENWQDSNWAAMGVAIFENSASVWFGSEKDNSGLMQRCKESP